MKLIPFASTVEEEKSKRRSEGGERGKSIAKLFRAPRIDFPRALPPPVSQ